MSIFRIIDTESKETITIHLLRWSSGFHILPSIAGNNLRAKGNNHFYFKGSKLVESFSLELV